MKIVITGSIGNIGKPLTQQLVQRGHDVTVITSKSAKQAEIELLQAKPAVGTFFDVDFLSETFAGADIVYLMEAWEGIGSVFDQDKDFVAAFDRIGNNYKTAVERAGVKQVVHLSSIGAHTDHGVGSLAMHHNVENILRQLPGDVSIKFIRPVGFYTNLYRWIHSIKTQNAIVQTYGGDQKEPWVSPADIADAIVEEMEKPFEGRTVRYVASDEISPLELATVLGQAIGQPDLKWVVISEETMLGNMRALGMNEWIAQGFIAMQAAQGTGALYEDFYRHKPTLGSVKLKDFATEFANVYHHQTKAAV